MAFSQYHEDRKRAIFLKRAATVYGISMKKAERLFSIEQHSSLRINPLKEQDETTTVATITDLGIILTPIPWAEHCYFIDGNTSLIAQSSLFTDGYVFLQNASSFIPPIVLNPQPGETILDLCCAPGGKASHAAALCGNQCPLTINDKHHGRLEKTKEILSTLNVDVAESLNQAAEELDSEHRYDKILLDAQCSNEGSLNLQFRTAMRYWNQEKSQRKLPQLQLHMLQSAFARLKPGGELVYSTCTMAPEENEIVINRFLRREPTAQVLPIELGIENRIPPVKTWNNKPIDESIQQAIRIVPNDNFEAFFVCRLTKSA